MKLLNVCLVMVSLLMSLSVTARADGCFMCEGGTYVKYSGSDDQTKRKAAIACGCQITGTRGSCDAANLKILCSVKLSTDQNEKVACADHASDEVSSESGNESDALNQLN